MAVEPGTSLLHYTIVEKLGEGGMGAVWRATDTTLGRDVAIKALPRHFADDPERLARFEREAKLLAALNHPNIAAVYGLHAADTPDGPLRFLAMELVEGEDLQRRLARGPLSVERALDVARQMAAGIEAAHERGVVHRDLKPANAILTPDGRVKLLDFGLATSFETGADGSDPSLSPTMTSAGSVVGMILGTAAYMSPEQARGRPLDRRTDLWSFGCVVYECLTGVRLFAGETVSDSLAAILRHEPDWSALPDETPPMVRLLLRRCLTRDPAKRLRDAGDARLELEQAIEDPSVAALGLVGPGAASATPPTIGRAWLPWVLVAAALVAVVALALRGGDEAGETRAVRRLTIPVPGATLYGDGDEGASPPAVSPDGRLVVFGVTDDSGTSRLWLRPLDDFEARPLAGTEGAQYAFWSPDSRHVGYFLGGLLRSIEVTSGRIQPIGGEGSSFPRGGSWGPDGTILFAPNSNTGIWIIDAAGGPARQVTTPDPDIPDASHRWPCFLPDGEHFLFLLWTNDLAALERYGGVYLGSLTGDAPPVRIVADASRMAYAPSGHLLVIQGDNLMALPFDPDDGAVGGASVVVAEGVLRNGNNGHAAFSVSDEGTVVFVGAGAAVVPSSLVWFDRAGEAVALPVEPAPFQRWLRLSPDARRAAVVLPGATGDGEVWIVDLIRGVRTRLVSPGPWSFGQPVWSGDGRRVMYTSQELGNFDFYVRAADGSGEPLSFLTDAADKTLYDWSRDGHSVLFWRYGAGSGTPDVWIHDSRTGESAVLIGGEDAYGDARFSPDGRYIAYVADDSGRPEVYIQALERGARWQVSTAGGTAPHWRDDGREIVYSGPGRRMMAVSVELGADAATLGAPRALFTVSDAIVAGDAAGDHERFLLAIRGESPNEPLRVILGWDAGL